MKTVSIATARRPETRYTVSMKMKNETALTLWLVAPGVDYEGESAEKTRLFYAEADARAYEAELASWDYVVVRQVAVA